MNAMALIAPGAFLWITYQVQAAQTGPDGKTSTANDMWTGLGFALIVAFLTAISYSEMAKIYPEAGYGSAYYFAERTFLDKEEHGKGHEKWARISKLITGWAAHLFYWVYPGVMVAFFATLVSYIAGLFGVGGSANPGLSVHMQMAVCVIFSLICGYIAMRGISGSTMTSIIVNIIQWITLIFFSILAVTYRMKNPSHANFGTAIGGFPSASSIVIPAGGGVVPPHSLPNILYQATIAILVLVGFESCTALGADAKDPKHSVPKGVILALIVQGLFSYMIEYFCANYAISDALKSADGKTVGMAEAAASSAPIGDMMRLFGDSLLGHIGFALDVTMAITVVLAVLGTTLACLNTAVRVSYAMSKDNEMPEILALMHGKFNSPVAAIWVLSVFSALVGCIGVSSVVGLTGIGIASNLGTFCLYCLICVWTIIAFAHRPDRNVLKHVIIPLAGFCMNIVMVATIFYLAFAAGGDSKREGLIAIYFAAGWALISIVYVVINSAKTGRKLIAAKASY